MGLFRRRQRPHISILGGQSNSSKRFWRTARRNILAIALWSPASGAGATWGGNVPGGSGVPQITSVTFSGTGQNLQIDIHGSGFGSAPAAMPLHRRSKPIQFGGFSNALRRWFISIRGWFLALGNGSPDSLTLAYQSWSDNEIVIGGFGGTYGRVATRCKTETLLLSRFGIQATPAKQGRKLPGGDL